MQSFYFLLPFPTLIDHSNNLIRNGNHYIMYLYSRDIIEQVNNFSFLKNRNQYWKEGSKYLNLKIGIEILSEPIIEPMKVNFWRSKSTLSVGKFKFILPGSDASYRGFTTQVKLDYLKEVNYRIFLSIDNESDWEELFQRLISHKYFYPPYLGHANLFAEINYLGLFESNTINEGDFRTVIPKLSLDNDIYNDFSEMGGFKVIYGVPKKYKTNEVIVDNYSRWNNTPFGSESFIIPPFSKDLHLNLKDGFGKSNRIDNKEYHICVF